MVSSNIKKPEEECEDKKCPHHGNLKVRGRTFEGKIVSDKMDNTVIIERYYSEKVPKFERYERRSSRIQAHNPPCIGASEGDEVKIGECRKLSKQKSFVVLEKKQAEGEQNA